MIFSEYINPETPKANENSIVKNDKYSNEVKTGNIDDEDDLGLIDNIESATKNFKMVTENINEIKEAITDLGKKINVRSSNMNPNNQSNVKIIINSVSIYMDTFVELLDERKPVIYKKFSEGINNISNVI